MGACNQDSTEKLTTTSEILNFCETVKKCVNKNEEDEYISLDYAWIPYIM